MKFEVWMLTADLCKILVIYLQSRSNSWFDDVGVERTGEGERRALEYPHAEGPRFRDQPDVEDVEETDGVLASRVVPSRLRDEGDQ